MAKVRNMNLLSSDNYFDGHEIVFIDMHLFKILSFWHLLQTAFMNFQNVSSTEHMLTPYKHRNCTVYNFGFQHLKICK